MTHESRETYRSAALLGRDVISEAGEDLGHIEEIAIDPEHGCVAYAVLSFGGVLGVGAKFLAVPWKSLRIDHAHGDFVIDATKRQLEQAQGFDPEAWPSHADATTFPAKDTHHEHDPDSVVRPEARP